MKKTLLLFSFIIFSCAAFAAHLKGGFFTYKYLGVNAANGRLQYKVNLTVYMECNANNQQLNSRIPITVFDAGTNALVQNLDADTLRTYRLIKRSEEDCINNSRTGCFYRIVVYELPLLELAPNGPGYILSYQRCCRIDGIVNLQAPSDRSGNTYSITIPGNNAGISAPKNNSPEFLVNDTAIVCRSSYFQLPFIATDSDGDSLSYSFCSAWTGGGTDRGPAGGPFTPAPNPSAPPPYASVLYASGFSGGQPLGPDVKIDSKTGLISGIAPGLGEYVVTVCITEYRLGVPISQTRKELHLLVSNCDLIKATLRPEYVNCQDGSVSFSNATPNGISTYFWDFGVSGVNNDTSNLAAPSFNYPDTGTYTLKLVVNKGGKCSDSSTALVKVYPGFFPDFSFEGICTAKPTQFRDRTQTRFGTVASWSWDFGDLSTTTDTSTRQNPTYSYPVSGTRNVRLIVGSDKGCRDTVSKDLTIYDKPPMSLPFRDTLICSGDTLQLRAIGNGSFSWRPAVNIINPNTASPSVYPSATQQYIARLNDQGCINEDTVQVRVVNIVSLQARGDTAICLTDSVQLGAITNGHRFEWKPAADFSDPTRLDAFARPKAPRTVYQLTAHIGKCSTTDEVVIQTSPYPAADAGPDQFICFRSATQLNASITGTGFQWSPTLSLVNSGTLNPIAQPRQTTAYVLTVFDRSGFCPKPASDTVMVRVGGRITAFAGRDTSVVIGQPLQLKASGGVSYQWVPARGLSNPLIFNPVGRYDGSFDSIRYKVLVNDAEGCTDSAFVTVKIYQTIPRIFVPTAFTPNGDGRNDVVKPIAVGIERIEYFRIYNRWGQLVFSTTANGHGWDGRINTQDQGTNVFVWMVKAVDYTGKPYFAKGTVTLIR